MQEIIETTPISTMTDGDFAAYVAAIATAEPWLLVPNEWELDDAPTAIKAH